MKTALILLSPGALVAALIIWPKFRTVALCTVGVVMIWTTIVICSAKGAHADDVMVSCQLNKRDAPVIARMKLSSRERPRLSPTRAARARLRNRPYWV